MGPLPKNIEQPIKSISWDWYQVTANKTADDAVEMAYNAMIELEPNAQSYEIRDVKGRLSYQKGVEVFAIKGGNDEKRQESVFCTILYDRKGQDDDEVHITTTSSISSVMAPYIREWSPDHRVTRADVCVDISGGEAEYNRIKKLVRNVVNDRARPISIIEMKSEVGEINKGRTLYIGKRLKGASPVIIRMYEKGLQDSSYSPDIVRIEMQIRPVKREKKIELALLEPNEVLTATKWAGDVWEALEWRFENLWRCSPAWEATKTERAIDNMLKQYGSSIREYVAIYGVDNLTDRIKARI